MPTLLALWLAGAGAAAPALPNVPVTPPPAPVNEAATPVAEPTTEAEKAPKTGQLLFDAKQPAELLVDGVKLGQLYYAGQARFDVLPGRHRVRVYLSGQPTDTDVEVVAGVESRVLIGRTGVTVSRSDVAAAPHADVVSVEMRMVGGGGAQVRVDDQRYRIDAGGQVSVPLASGVHAVSFRSADGTVIWASGTLELAGGEGVIVQLAEGRMPEVSGPGKFDAGGG